MNIEDISVDNFFALPDINLLIDEYRNECGNKAFGMAPPSQSHYSKLADAGVLFPAVAKDEEGKPVGFVVLLAISLPHFEGKMMANVESIFLAKKHRKGASGLALIKWARSKAKQLGAVGVYLSAPVGSRLEVLAHKLFKKTNSVFFVEV